MQSLEYSASQLWKLSFRLVGLVSLMATSAGVASAEHWDVYLIGGQSNAVGWNTNLNDLPISLQGPQADVFFFNGLDGSWGALAPGSGNIANAFGPEVTFGWVLADGDPTRNVAIVKYAVGSTDLINDWNPDDPGVNQYDNFLTTFNNAISQLPVGDTYTVGGMVWMQGERDTRTAAAAGAYETNLPNFISNVRSDIGSPQMPFAIGQLAYTTSTSRPNWPVVQNAQANTAALDNDVSLVITTDLPIQGDGVHLSSAAQQTFGERLALAIKGQIDQLQIANPSFETPDLSDGGINTAIVSGWAESAGTIGTFNPSTNFYSDSSITDSNGGLIGDMDGVHTMFFTGTDAAVEQTLSKPVEAGMMYVLTVAVGDRDTGGGSEFAGARIELLAGGQVVADSGDIVDSLGDGTFTDVTISYTAQPTDLGALGIRLISLGGSSGHSVDFDNIRLTVGLDPTVSAQVVPIVNHDFESNGQTDDAFSTGAIDGWAEIGTGGILNSSVDRFYTDVNIIDTSATGGVIGSMDGPNVAFGVNNSVISQVLTSNVVVGTEYLLEVSIGDRDFGGLADNFAGFNIELWDGDSQLATTGDVLTSPGGQGVFADATLSYTAQAGDAGLLEIRLSTLDGGAGTDFDNVRLTATIPGPCVLGDVDQSGVVDFLDISPFIAILSNGGFQCEADTDESGVVDFLDISPFISILSGQ